MMSVEVFEFDGIFRYIIKLWEERIDGILLVVLFLYVNEMCVGLN